MREEKRYNRRGHQTGKAKILALSGIFLSLTVLILYLESIVPTGRLSLFALSSFFVSVIVIETGASMGWLFYIGASLMSLIIVPNKTSVMAYVLFFGFYGLIKYYSEKTPYRILEYFLKFAFFNGMLIVGYLLITRFFFKQVEIRFPIWVIIILLEVLFGIYDFVYSMFIQFYRERVRKVLRF